MCSRVSVHLHLFECGREAVGFKRHKLGVDEMCVCVCVRVRVSVGATAGISFPLPDIHPLAQNAVY